MADLSDVMTSLVNMASAAVYPNGTSQSSAAGIPVMVYPGWPVPNQLNADIAAGKAHVSVYPRPEEKNTSRYPTGYSNEIISPATLTATVNGDQVTIGGTVSTPQAVMVLNHFEKLAYSYLVLATDTLNSIAVALAALIPGASAAGAVVTIPGAYGLTTRIITSGTATKAVRRQERLFQLCVWAPTPATRDSIAKVVDAALAQAERFLLPDNSYARLTYKQSPMNDNLQKSRIYRRDFYYTVEYPTTVSSTFFAIGKTKIITSH